jgi:hypothetical protein
MRETGQRPENLPALLVARGKIQSWTGEWWMTKPLGSTIVLCIFGLLFMVAFGWLAWDIADDPPNNCTYLIDATVASYTPAHLYTEMGPYGAVEVTTPEVLVVRLKDGSLHKTYISAVAEDKCVAGGPVTAATRIGKIWHRVISVDFGICRAPQQNP